MREACGSPCSARKRPFGTFQCFDRLITEESPTGASFVKRSISSRFAASDNAGSLRLPLLRTETPLWDVPVFRSAYYRRKPHRGFLRQTLDLQPLCGLRQCGEPAAPLAPHGNAPLGRSSVSIGLLAKKAPQGLPSSNARSPAALRPSTMREACGSPCSARKRPFGTFQCSDRLVVFGNDAGGLRAPRTPRGIKRCRVLLRCAAACQSRRSGGRGGAPGGCSANPNRHEGHPLSPARRQPAPLAPH